MNLNETVNYFIDMGADISGAVIASTIGGAVAGPVGVVVGAIAGTAIETAVCKIGTDINERLLSEQENKKIGATATFSLMKIQENLNKGKRLRQDNFFEEDLTGRSTADEIAEGVLFAAQKEHEEKKLKYYGNLLANISFDSTISREMANQLLSLADQLTYRQLKLLSLLVVNQISNGNLLRNGNYSMAPGVETISVLQDIYDLYRIGLINGGGEVILEMGYINPSKICIQGIGVLVYNLMELNSIPKIEVDKLIEILS